MWVEKGGLHCSSSTLRGWRWPLGQAASIVKMHLFFLLPLLHPELSWFPPIPKAGCRASHPFQELLHPPTNTPWYQSSLCLGRPSKFLFLARKTTENQPSVLQKTQSCIAKIMRRSRRIKSRNREWSPGSAAEQNQTPSRRNPQPHLALCRGELTASHWSRC